MKITIKDFIIRSFFILILPLLSFNFCVIYFPIDRPKTPYRRIEPDFKQGILFHVAGDKRLKNIPIIFDIYSEKNVLFQSVKVYSNMVKSASLSPGTFRVKTRANYSGKEIWKSYNSLQLKEKQIIDFYFTMPLLFSSSPKIEIKKKK